MKKILMIALVAVFGMGTTAFAQSKEYAKQQIEYKKNAENMAKKKAKALKKQKWETTSATPLESALATFYLETEPTCGGAKRGQEQTVNDAQSLAIAEKRLLLNAQSAYAQEVRTMLAHNITEQSSAAQGEEFDNYISNVAAKSQNEFNGDVKRSFLIYRTNPDGKTLTVRAFYVIDEENGLARAKNIAERVKLNNESAKQIENAANGK